MVYIVSSLIAIPMIGCWWYPVWMCVANYPTVNEEYLDDEDDSDDYIRSE